MPVISSRQVAKTGDDNTATQDGGFAVPSPSSSALTLEEQIAVLEAEKAGLEAKLVGMEVEEQRPIAEQDAAAGYSLRNFTPISGLHLRIFSIKLVYSFCVTLICFCVSYPVASTVA